MSTKYAVLVVSLLAVFLAVGEAKAECSLKADYAEFASTRIAVARLSDAAPAIQVIEDGLANTLFGSVPHIQKPRLLTTESVSDVISAYTARMDDFDLFVILDEEMMIGGRPKYSEILTVYNDAQIKDDEVVLIDGYPKDATRPSVVLLNGNVDPSVIPWIIEGIALVVLESSPTLTPKLMEYVRLLSISSYEPGNPSKTAQAKRQEILTELCF